MAVFSNIKVYVHLKAGRDGKLLAMLTTNNKLDKKLRVRIDDVVQHPLDMSFVLC